MTGKSLVIGYGNALRGDDGIGQAVAQAFANEPAFDCATVVVCHQLTPELAEDIAAMDLVVFIDAALGIEPGSVVVREIAAASVPSSGLVHTADPAALLDLAGTLYGRSPQAFLVTVGVGSLALSDALSQAAAAALPAAIAAVRRLVSPPSGEG